MTINGITIKQSKDHAELNEMWKYIHDGGLDDRQPFAMQVGKWKFEGLCVVRSAEAKNLGAERMHMGPLTLTLEVSAFGVRVDPTPSPDEVNPRGEE